MHHAVPQEVPDHRNQPHRLLLRQATSQESWKEPPGHKRLPLK